MTPFTPPVQPSGDPVADFIAETLREYKGKAEEYDKVLLILRERGFFSVFAALHEIDALRKTRDHHLVREGVLEKEIAALHVEIARSRDEIVTLRAYEHLPLSSKTRKRK